jgi:hypothetical protein
MKQLLILQALSTLFASSAQTEIISANASRAVSENEMKGSLREIDLVGVNGAPLHLRALMANGRSGALESPGASTPESFCHIEGFKAIAAHLPSQKMGQC